MMTCLFIFSYKIKKSFLFSVKHSLNPPPQVRKIRKTDECFAVEEERRDELHMKGACHTSLQIQRRVRCGIIQTDPKRSGREAE